EPSDVGTFVVSPIRSGRRGHCCHNVATWIGFASSESTVSVCGRLLGGLNSENGRNEPPPIRLQNRPALPPSRHEADRLVHRHWPRATGRFLLLSALRATASARERTEIGIAAAGRKIKSPEPLGGRG